MLVQRHAANYAGVLRAAALNDAVSIGGIGRAQDRKRHAAMPENGSRRLPSVQRLGQHAIPELDGQLINVLGCEVVPHIVVAGTVLAAQIAWQRRENGPRCEWQESAVRNRVQAVAPSVIRLHLDAMRHPLVGRYLQTVVVAVGAGAQLRDGPEPGIFRPPVRKGGEAARADRLIAVHLSLIGLVHGARAHVLSS